MEDKPKRRWTKPVLRKLEPTDELLQLLAANAKVKAVPPVKHMK